MSSAERHPVLADYERYVNPAFVKLLGTFGYGRVFVRGKGTSLWDDQGRQYLDMLAGFGAVNLGHNPEALIERMVEFLRDDAPNLVHVGPQLHAAELARRLARVAGAPLEISLFSNSGGEAVEAAMKLGRAATGRSHFVYAEGGFHGTGLGSLSIMGHARLREPFEPLLADCQAVPFGDLDALEQALHRRRVAAFVVEPIQAEAGILLPPAGYLKSAQELCTKYGTLLVLDEVQTGLGRTGSVFAYQQHGFVPDVLVLGKSLGGSMVPLSVTLTSREVHQKAYGSQAKFDLHGTTYSGNALSCRVGSEVLKLIEEQGLSQRAERLGAALLEQLRRALSGHPLVREVRGLGLLVGIELGPTNSGFFQRAFSGVVESVSEKVFGQWLAVRLLERGIVCQPASQHWNVLRLEPPLTISETELSHAVSEIAQLLGEYTKLTPLLKDVTARLTEQYRGGWSFR
ncbi:MAG TPA: aminotransferase class III-fold pyridoxal phosphate-dependent enzyme [Polyangiaceae bacterium]|nr:aminotransferase class III-fold pyridoxal phosphate-dependent enzyme [Polyangiaceae bacterium]